jgi:hemerythrin-like domain-containing protein
VTTGNTATARKTTGSGSRRRDAIAVLREDHREVEKLFKRFERAGEGAVEEKRHVAESIAEALVQHTSIEQQVVYPWAREYIVDADAMILEAIEEHRVVTWLLADIATTAPGDERFDAKVTVMIEAVRHHVEEEEAGLFPDLRTVATRDELLELGDALLAAKRSAPTAPDPDDGAQGLAASAVGHAYDLGKGVVERIGAIAGVG